jgi:hypothetical protein
MQKQAVEIKSDMLLAENRRTIEEKDVRISILGKFIICAFVVLE